MSVKITKTGVGSENEALLFEFLPHELPSSIGINYKTSLGTSKFIGSLQTNQIQGAYLEPISFRGVFFGSYIDGETGQRISAKERSDELGRLQGRVVKFFYENIKTIAIISDYSRNIFDYGKVEYSVTFQPHDIQHPVKPSQSKQFLLASVKLANTPIASKKGDKDKKNPYTKPFSDIFVDPDLSPNEGVKIISPKDGGKIISIPESGKSDAEIEKLKLEAESVTRQRRVEKAVESAKKEAEALDLANRLTIQNRTVPETHQAYNQYRGF